MKARDALWAAASPQWQKWREHMVLSRWRMAVRDGCIVWVGRASELPPALIAAELHDLPEGGWLTPGLIDCHTHLVFAGERSARIRGEAGRQQLRGGGAGGRRHPVDSGATRVATEQALVEAARPRLTRLMADGVTTVEIKSGYGLTFSPNSRCCALTHARASATTFGCEPVSRRPHRSTGIWRPRRMIIWTTSLPTSSLPSPPKGLPMPWMVRRKYRLFNTQMARIFKAAQAPPFP